MKYHILHVCAPNDTNGNPRRLYYVTDLETGKVTAYDEEYRGRSAVPDEIQRSAIDGGSIDVPVSEYRFILKHFRSN